MSKLLINNCICGEMAIYDKKEKAVVCNCVHACGRRSPSFKSKDEAVLYWNRINKQLSELKQHYSQFNMR